jgi:hypothetical protein
MKNNILALSIFSLALSIVIGSWLIAQGIIENGSSVTEGLQTMMPTVDLLAVQPQLFTQSELSVYLGLTEDEIEKLGPSQTGSTNGESMLPYLQVGDTLYYPKEAIDKWLQSLQATIAY